MGASSADFSSQVHLILIGLKLDICFLTVEASSSSTFSS